MGIFWAFRYIILLLLVLLLSVLHDNAYNAQKYHANSLSDLLKSETSLVPNSSPNPNDVPTAHLCLTRQQCLTAKRMRIDRATIMTEWDSRNHSCCRKVGTSNERTESGSSNHCSNEVTLRGLLGFFLTVYILLRMVRLHMSMPCTTPFSPRDE